MRTKLNKLLELQAYRLSDTPAHGLEVGWNLSGLVMLRLQAGQAFSVHPLQISSDAGKHIPEPINHLLFALWVALQFSCAVCECCL